MSRKKETTNEFILKARVIHGGKYNYGKVVYKGNNEKVIITCPIHGDFPQTPHCHKSGQGCPWCAGTVKLTVEEFIRKAQSKHGDKYDYSMVKIYGNNKSKVKIKCNKCGHIFEQGVGNHLHGHGCPICVGNKHLTKNEFIAKAKEKHGDKYDYSLVSDIKNNRTKVKIKCNTCGAIFEQKVNNHLNGQGCPSCNMSHLEEQTWLLLEKHNIKYESEKTFPWLKNKREMPLDFYLPEYNVAIECQGIQHYMEEGRGYFTTERVRETQQRDKLKYKLCQEHGIQIFYINYNDKVEEAVGKLVSNLK